MGAGQYLSIWYTDRLAEAGIEPSVGSTGDSYDNALAESVIRLFKLEEIYRRGPWTGLENVEIATRRWVAWYNYRRLLKLLGYVPPAEFEQAYYDRQAAPGAMAIFNNAVSGAPVRFTSLICDDLESHVDPHIFNWALEV